MVAVAEKVRNDKVFVPRKRQGTKSFLNVFPLSISKTKNSGVRVKVLRKLELNCEYDRRSWGYILLLWSVSVIAGLVNYIQAISLKLFIRRKDSLQKILWDLGRSEKHISSFFVDRFSRFNHQAKYGAAGWKSLIVFYYYWEKIRPQLKNDFEGWLTRFWIERMENRQAVTNRLKIVIDLLVHAFGKFFNEPEIRVLSIAGGSADAVIAAMKKWPNLNVRVVLIDADFEVLKVGKKNAEDAGLEDKFTFILKEQGKSLNELVAEVANEFKPHIFEVVGFVDYLSREKAIQLFSTIRSHMSKNGIFLTGNIRRNREMIFLFLTLLWPMIYRTKKQFADLFIGAGFTPKKVELIYEPHEIHGIGVANV